VVTLQVVQRLPFFTQLSYQWPPEQVHVCRLQPEGQLQASAVACGTMTLSSRSAAFAIRLIFFTSSRVTSCRVPEERKEGIASEME
jgi:hypothetical protein